MKTEYKKNQERINNRILIVLALLGILAIYGLAKLLNINIIL